MESNYFDIEDRKGIKQENTIKIKFFNVKEKSINQSTLEKNYVQNNSLLFSNETNERTIFREIKKDPNINPQYDNRFNNNTKISEIKNLQSLPPSNFKSEPEPIIFSNSCLSTVSNFNDINMIKDNSSDLKQSNSITPLYMNEIQKTYYNEIPEKEYYDDILSELIMEEEQNLYYKNCSYIEFQQDLNNKRRAELISFIYKMSKVYMFKTRTIFLAVQTMDRFLCKEKIDPEYYDLLCICALVIASKFNEIYYPAFRDIISLFANNKNYTVKQALTMELLILKTINYNLFPIFPMYFFDIISQKCELNNVEYNLGCLMIELIQFDFCLYPIKNSILSQTVFCKVMALTRGNTNDSFGQLKNIFPKENFEFFKENANLVGKASFVIDELLHNLNAEYFKDIYEKYSQPNYLGNSINYFLNM
jgi:G2/mitotic-specific cyclin 1/2